MSPKKVLAWANYHKVSEVLADATEALLAAEQCRRNGLICNCAKEEALCEALVKEYRKARKEIDR